MPKAETLVKLIRRDRERIEEKVSGLELAGRLLPADLAEELLANSEIERKRLLDRLAIVDRNLERLDVHLARARAQEAQVKGLIPARTMLKELGDGTMVEKTRRAAVVATPESMERRQVCAQFRRQIKHNKAERRQLQSELSEIARIRAIARRGELNELLGLAARWSNPVMSITLTRITSSSPLRFTDAAGNELPPEALGPDGRPAIDVSGHRAPDHMVATPAAPVPAQE